MQLLDNPLRSDCKSLSTFEEAHLEPKNRAVQGAVPEETESAGVRGHVAADLTSALGAKVQRHGEPVLGEEGVQRLQDAARLFRATDAQQNF